MNIHQNARLTPQGRALLVSRILDEGWQVADAAAAAGLSKRRAHVWLARFKEGGKPALEDRSSTPLRSPHALPRETIAEIERLRRERMTGQAIARELGLPRSTVGAILRRRGLGRLSALAPKPPAIRYQREHPGELIHRAQERSIHSRRDRRQETAAGRYQKARPHRQAQPPCHRQPARQRQRCRLGLRPRGRR
jgi:transposase